MLLSLPYVLPTLEPCRRNHYYTNSSTKSKITQDILMFFKENDWISWTCTIALESQHYPIVIDKNFKNIILCPFFLEISTYDQALFKVKSVLDEHMVDIIIKARRSKSKKRTIPIPIPVPSNEEQKDCLIRKQMLHRTYKNM